jgi:hypothetical protein
MRHTKTLLHAVAYRRRQTIDTRSTQQPSFGFAILLLFRGLSFTEVAAMGSLVGDDDGTAEYHKLFIHTPDTIGVG